MKARMFTMVLAAAALGLVAAGADELQAEIARLHQQIRGFDTNTEALSRDYLALLEKYDTPEDIGRIYAGLTEMYGDSGLTDPLSAAKYAERPLEYPLDPLTTITVYEEWGDALQVKHRGVRGEDLVRARKEAVVPYLRGLKYALDLGVPDEDVELPRLDSENHSASSLEELAWLRQEQEKKVQVYRDARLLNDMVLQKRICVNQMVFLYSRYPFKTDELRTMAAEILQNDAEAEKLVAKVQAKIAERVAEQAKREQEQTVSDLGEAIEPPDPAALPETALASALPEKERRVPPNKPAPAIQVVVPKGSNRTVLIAVCCVAAAAILGLIARGRLLRRGR